MSIEILTILLVTGAVAGILAGLFGVGGGIVIVPVLITIYSRGQVPPEYVVQAAIATSLFTIIFTTLSSSYKHSKNDNIVFSAALIIGMISSVTVFIFSGIAIGLQGETLKKIFAGILVLTAVKMLFEKSPENNPLSSPFSKGEYYLRCSLIGVFSGIVAAFSGLGGGLFIVPLMTYLLKFPIKKAIGTSSAAILLTAISGVIGYSFNTPAGVNMGKYSLGLVDTYSALPIIIISIPTTQLGVYLHNKISRSVLKNLFAVFAILVSVRVLFF